jgi:hypothetical protein
MRRPTGRPGAAMLLGDTKYLGDTNVWLALALSGQLA